MNNTEQLIQRLGTVVGHLDTARGCFHHFLNHMTSPEQLAQYSEQGHQCVQESRQALKDLCEELRKAKQAE